MNEAAGARSTSLSNTERTRSMVVAALLAGMIAATSWITVPLFGPVPVTLQTVFVLLAGLLLPARWAVTSMLLYLALGVAGLPVFSQGQSGLAAILGPTGGFLLAFPFAAGAAALVQGALGGRYRPIAASIAAVIVAEIVLYAVGIPWLMAQTGLSLVAALTAAFVPFIVPDAIKAAFAVSAASAIKRAMGQIGVERG